MLSLRCLIYTETKQTMSHFTHSHSDVWKWGFLVLIGYCNHHNFWSEGIWQSYSKLLWEIIICYLNPDNNTSFCLLRASSSSMQEAIPPSPEHRDKLQDPGELTLTPVAQGRVAMRPTPGHRDSTHKAIDKRQTARCTYWILLYVLGIVYIEIMCTYVQATLCTVTSDMQF